MFDEKKKQEWVVVLRLLAAKIVNDFGQPYTGQYDAMVEKMAEDQSAIYDDQDDQDDQSED